MSGNKPREIKGTIVVSTATAPLLLHDQREDLFQFGSEMVSIK